MNTSKPISTISYNTIDFLVMKLNELKQGGLISFWCFIHHMAEDDEGGKKDHNHLYIEPSKRINTDKLQECFQEVNIDDLTKPLGCICFRSSKWVDWYFYTQHDKLYLASKGLEKKYFYKVDDFVYSNGDDFQYLVKTSSFCEVNPLFEMVNCVLKKQNFTSYVRSHNVPIQQISAYIKAYDVACDIVDDMFNDDENKPF